MKCPAAINIVVAVATGGSDGGGEESEDKKKRRSPIIPNPASNYVALLLYIHVDVWSVYTLTTLFYHLFTDAIMYL